jgi:hypothetical protein
MMFMLAIGDRCRASSRLRVWDHVNELRGSCITLQVDSVVPMALAHRKFALAVRLLVRLPLWIFWLLQARRVYIQETLILWPLVALLAKPMKKIVIFDFSDPIDTLDSGLIGYFRLKGFNAMVRYATHVIVENRVYQKDLPRNDIYQFYGPVDALRYTKEFNKKPVGSDQSSLRIGWTGSPGTLKFIVPLFNSLDQLANELNLELFLIGISNHGYKFKNLPVTCIAWNEDQEFSEIPKFDLGLHALDDTPESLKRGAGKLFIYMAAGVPFITDAYGIGSDVAYDSGIGTLVRKKSDWLTSLRSVLTDSEIRAQHSYKGIEYANSNMSYQSFRHLIKKLFLLNDETDL